MWVICRRRLHIILLVMVAAWWALWDFQRQSRLIPMLSLRLRIDPALLQPLLFFGLPIGIVGLLRLASYSLDNRKWTLSDILRLAFWRTVSPTMALLFVATGFDALYRREWVGILWLVFAAIIAVVGTLQTQLAEGIKLRRVKSGELYKRALVMAKEMGTPLKRVYVVPAGRGHLTNAFGLTESIAVTDNYGKFLDQAELDFVIGHELGHAKGKHSRKKMLVMPIIFVVFAVTCFVLPSSADPFRPILDIFVILVPILAFCFFSRRFEYAADESAVEFTHDPKAAIRALASLYRFTQAPTDCDRITELFMTHPAFVRRAAAIGGIGHISDHP
jgi:Zn-dependent protease with chaperone function